MRLLLACILLNIPFFMKGSDSIPVDYGKVCVKLKDAECFFIHSRDIFREGLDTLNHTIFWRRIMRLTPDSGALSTYSSRKILVMLPVKEWTDMGEVKQDAWRDSLRKVHKLDSAEKILFTKGKSDFYKIEDVIPDIHRGILVFDSNGVDPFYAQAILLIESPGRLQKSPVGAYGPFQLMRRVAVKMGLTVTKYKDERKDFDRSAWAAAKLLRTICIPYTNAMLEKRGIAWCESDLWYRLLVLHTYHAGAGNVEKALSVINPTVGSMDLIKTLWQTRAGAFGNSSQNYSQLAIASILELDETMGYVLSKE